MTTLFATPDRLRRLQIEITTGCNLGCVGCQRTIGIADKTWRNINMPLTRYEAVLANAPPADVLILQGIGEPTLHVKLPQMIAAGRAAGKFGVVSFNTNALLHDLAYYERLKALGLGHVSVSVDSLVPETAEALRAGTDCEALREMVRGLSVLFDNTVTLSVVLSRRNLPELPSLLSELYGLGARAIELQPLISYAERIDSMALAAADLQTVRRIAGEAQARHPGLAALLAPAVTPNGSRCRRPFTAGYVTVAGFLTPCCTTNDIDLFGRTSLAELDWARAWEGPGVQRWLQSYFDREPEICLGCAFNPSGAKPARATQTLADATTLHRAGKLDQAAAAFSDLLAEGASAEALQGLGLIRFQKDDPAGALPLLEAAEALAPTARGAFNLAVILAQLGRTADAMAAHRRNIETHPDYPAAYTTLAALLAASGEAAEAASILATLIELALKAGAKGILDDAAGQLLKLDADPPNLTLLANTLRMGGRQDLSTALLARRLERAPTDVAARLALAMARLATIHGSEAEIAERRAAYAADIFALETVLDQAPPETLREGAGEVGNAKPFLLAYQGGDDTAMQAAYGRIASRLSRARAPVTALSPASGGKLRIGFATAYFHQHSISKLFRGWVSELDRSRFEVFGYHLGDDHDAMSAELGGACDVYRHGLASQDVWAKTIAGDGLHALIYPEIGMHPLPVQLACRRLAPVQAMAWGHPVTSGLPEIDYFLTSDLMEPADGERHYVETLIRLPNLSIWYPPVPSEGGRLTRADLGLPADAMVYVCCQSLFKYLPRHDHVFADIAKRVTNARFLFLKDGRAAVTEAFRARISTAFASAGLSMDDHVVMANQVPYEDFPSLLRAGDLCLDSIGWSGGNTTLEALTCDLPAITWPVGLMRGRHTAAILTRMGLETCIADSAETYVDLAARFAEPAARAALRTEVASRKGLLFHDLTAVRALEDFLARAIRQSLTEAEPQLQAATA